MMACISLCGCKCNEKLGTASGSSADSVITNHWDATFAETMRKANNAVAQRLHPFANHPSTKQNLAEADIAGFPTYGAPVKVSKEQLAILRFILECESSYASEVPNWKTPFAPYIAIKLGKGHDEVQLLIAYNTTEWALAKDGKIVKRNAYTYDGLLLQFGMDLFPGDEYFTSMIKTKSENKK